MAVFELCVQGILSHDREAVIHAMMLDPLSAAACSLGEIRAMAEELFAAEKSFIPAWCRKPKAVRAGIPQLLQPKTEFVMSPLASRIMPPAPLESLAYPSNKRVLGLAPRAFKGTSFCDRHVELHKAGAALVYFAAKISCKTPMRLAMLLGYDGPVKAWIDGREAFHDRLGSNPACVDAAKVPFDAAKGEHEILIALDSNQGSAAGIFLRFERLDLPKFDVAKGIRRDMLPVVMR